MRKTKRDWVKTWAGCVLSKGTEVFEKGGSSEKEKFTPDGIGILRKVDGVEKKASPTSLCASKEVPLGY